MDYMARYYQNKCKNLQEELIRLQNLLEIASAPEKKEPSFKDKIASRIDANTSGGERADAAASEFFGSVQKMASMIKNKGIKPELDAIASEVEKKSQNVQTGNPISDAIVGGVSSFAGEKIADALRSNAAANVATTFAMRQRHSDKYKEIDAERKKLLDAGKTPAQAESDLQSRYKNYYYKLDQ